MTAPRILLAAVEPSADAMGADLIRALDSILPGAELMGCGGPLMEAAGFQSAFDIDAFSVMGFTDVARVLPEAWARSRQMARMCEQEQIDVAVFIDGWSFSRLAAKRIRQRAPATKIVKFSAPQVWASRPQRIDFVREHFDLVLALLPFETDIFEAAGVRCQFIGNPNFEHAANRPRSGDGFRKKYGLGDDPVLMVLPGSRKGEVTRLLDVFGDSVAQAHAQLPGLRTVVAAAPAVSQLVNEGVATWPTDPLIIGPEERFDAYDAADAAIAASGTVSTELAMSATPMVVAYRVDPLTAYWAKRVLVTKFVSIINIAAQDDIIPERLQDDCTPEQLSADIVRLLTDPKTRNRQLSAFRQILPTLRAPDTPSVAAAEAIAELLQAKHRIDLDRGP